MTLPLLAEPRVNRVTECMEKDEISMDDMGGEGLDPNCTFEAARVEGNTMTWSFDCPVEGGSAHGEWRAVSSGDSVTGGGSLTMTVQNQTMQMTMVWEGSRVGDCP